MGHRIQMSFMAVAGIFTLYKPIYMWLHPYNRILSWIWGSICVSLSAQIFTFPLYTPFVWSFLLLFHLHKLYCYTMRNHYYLHGGSDDNNNPANSTLQHYMLRNRADSGIHEPFGILYSRTARCVY
jgi:uncharacterized MAPEG superfamily protein